MKLAVMIWNFSYAYAVFKEELASSSIKPYRLASKHSSESEGGFTRLTVVTNRNALGKPFTQVGATSALYYIKNLFVHILLSVSWWGNRHTCFSSHARADDSHPFKLKSPRLACGGLYLAL